jgi:pyrimidine operon attenuation protein/uracil phosphoribosyltransferase
MLTDNELILLGIESEMERLANNFKSMLEHCKIDHDKTFLKLVEYRDQYGVLAARHESLVDNTFNEVPF